MSSGPLHLNTLIHNIISLLKRYDDGLSFDKLKSLLNLDVTSSPELMTRLKNNPRITVTDNRLLYKPPFSIKSPQDLIEHLSNNDERPGLLINELKESYKTIEADIAQTSLGGSVYRITFNDISAVHLNKMPGINAAPDEVKALWMGMGPAAMSFTD